MSDAVDSCGIWDYTWSVLVQASSDYDGLILFLFTIARQHPFVQVSILCLFVSLLTFVVSSITHNYSQVDKLWSIIPFLYTWLLVNNGRTFLMACCATVWGLRLTWNFYRRGGYTWPQFWLGDEDYRWKLIQQGHVLPILTNPKVWIMFNAVFISLYQNVLLLLIVTPSAVAYAASQPELVHCFGTKKDNRGTALGRADVIIAIVFCLLVVFETIADNQQYRFQTGKYEWRRTKSKPPQSKKEQEYADGFCQSGLFAILRKPNYAAEQAIWITFYLFSIVATIPSETASRQFWFVNWSWVGCFLLILLFQGSGWLTEKITISKYGTKYRDYQKRVPLYVPTLSGIRSAIQHNLFLSNSPSDKARSKKKR